MPANSSSAAPSTWRPKRIEGHYDIREGAAGYAPIIGAFGALAVPAIIVLFTAPAAQVAHRTVYTSLAAGLLIVAMLGSVLGSIALAAIGAERDETTNLYASTMFEAVAVVISLAAVLAAFEVLAALYLPGAKTLFVLITGIGGLAGIFFTALAVADSWQSGPQDAADRTVWQPTQWLRDQRHAEKATLLIVGISGVPALVGVVLRLCGVEIAPTIATVNWLVGVGFVLTMAGVIVGAFRSRHAVDGFQKGLRPFEALGTTLTTSCYILALMIFLP